MVCLAAMHVATRNASFLEHRSLFLDGNLVLGDREGNERSQTTHQQTRNQPQRTLHRSQQPTRRSAHSDHEISCLCNTNKRLQSRQKNLPFKRIPKIDLGWWVGWGEIDYITIAGVGARDLYNSNTQCPLLFIPMDKW